VKKKWRRRFAAYRAPAVGMLQGEWALARLRIAGVKRNGKRGCARGSNPGRQGNFEWREPLR
jgi:hypothetical protein